MLTRAAAGERRAPLRALRANPAVERSSSLVHDGRSALKVKATAVAHGGVRALRSHSLASSTTSAAGLTSISSGTSHGFSHGFTNSASHAPSVPVVVVPPPPRRLQRATSLASSIGSIGSASCANSTTAFGASFCSDAVGRSSVGSIASSTGAVPPDASPRTATRLRAKRLRQSFDELQDLKRRRSNGSLARAAATENARPPEPPHLAHLMTRRPLDSVSARVRKDRAVDHPTGMAVDQEGDAAMHGDAGNGDDAGLDARPAKRQRGTVLPGDHESNEVVVAHRVLKRLLSASTNGGTTGPSENPAATVPARPPKRARRRRTTTGSRSSVVAAKVGGSVPLTTTGSNSAIEASPEAVLAALDAQWAAQTALVDRGRELRALRAHESRQLVPLGDFTRGGPQKWGWAMRARMVDWSVQASRYCGLGAPVLWHAVRLVDEVCAARAVAVGYLPLVATAGLWIAGKLQATCDDVPKAAFLADMLDGAFDAPQVVWAEHQVLTIVKFRACRPTPFAQINHLAAVDHNDPARSLLATYLTLCALTTPALLNAMPSTVGAAAYLAAAHAIHISLSTSAPGAPAPAIMAGAPGAVAAAAIVLADLHGPRSSGDAASLAAVALGAGVWTPHHVRFAGGAEAPDLAPVVVEVFRAAQAVRTSAPSLFALYADDIHQNVSVWFAQWAELNSFW